MSFPEGLENTPLRVSNLISTFKTLKVGLAFSISNFFINIFFFFEKSCFTLISLDLKNIYINKQAKLQSQHALFELSDFIND